MPNKTHLLCLLLALPATLSGCAAVAGGVAAVVVTQEMMDNNTYVTQLNQDVSKVWPTVKIFMADASLDLIETDEQARVAKATIDGSKVTVAVEAYDQDRSIVRVAAKRYGVNDGDSARLISERLVRRLEPRQ